MKGVRGLQQRNRNRKKINQRNQRYNRKTLLWLVLFFPVGLTRMLFGACTWKPQVKYAVTGLTVALLAAVVIVPSPYQRVQGGVELFGEDPEVEVYGPELPETIVGGYTAPIIESVVLPAEDPNAVDDTIYVYATKDQKNYHMSTCKFAYASGQKLTLYEAYYLGYTPGKCCDAPSYVPEN